MEEDRVHTQEISILSRRALISNFCLREAAWSYMSTTALPNVAIHPLAPPVILTCQKVSSFP